VTTAPTTELTARERDDEPFGGERHVYEPHRVGVPPLGRYAREVWRRRSFAFELSRTELRAEQFDTVFGKLWLLLNPLLLAGIYLVLVDILSKRPRGSTFLAHLVGAIFAYYFVSGSLTVAVRSVVSGGGLILNTAFPRVLLPLASVITGFKRFIPTLAIYIPLHLVVGLPIGLQLLWLIPISLLMLLLAAGLSMLVAALQVYFRDLKDFLPYILRLWLYASPVLYYANEVPHGWEWLLKVNPLGMLLTAWSDVLDKGIAPPPRVLALGAGWAVAAFVVGGLFFITREREFAVRI
jgi:ABC-type polysaccharide/polyol phosphate export permease